MGMSIGLKFRGRPAVLSRLAPAIAALIFLVSAASAQAAPPPSGSYRQTCQNIRIGHGVLFGYCQTRSNNFVRARLDRYRDCRGDIANDDGRLVCRDVQGDITLYEHTYFRGRSLSFNSDVSNLPRWFNDIASSIRLRRGTWQVCTDSNYRGRCETIRRDVEDLNRIGLNDRISSLRRVSDRYPGGGSDGQYGPPGGHGNGDYGNGGYGNGDNARLPRGSYQQSCRNAQLDRDTLRAECQDRYGNWRRTSFDAGNCRDDIANVNGELTCAGRNGSSNDGGYGSGDSARLPRGSYQQSCRNARLDGDTLRAECQDRDGNWQRTSFDTGNCRGDVANDNGELKCAAGNGNGGNGDHARLPRGSYEQSCRNARLDGDTLRAECQDRNGNWQRTSFDTGKCRGDIGNDNGELKCAGPTPPPPPAPPPPAANLPQGSYQQSCRNMVFERGTLIGECKSANGEWRKTSLDKGKCEKGADIGNDNGELKCAGPTPPSPPPPPPAANLPQGSYQQSCRNMVFERGTLIGECKSANGEWRKTSLDKGKCEKGADIGNDNGELKCAGPTPPPPPPPPPAGGTGAPPQGTRQPPEGSYQKSCRNFTVEHGTLKAECQDASGAWKQTSIELHGCRGAPDIGNDNGVLKCTPPASPQ